MIRESSPDVIVSFLTNVNVFTLIATIGIPTPVVVSERVDPAAEKETGVLLRLLRRVTYQLAAVVVVQSDRIARSLAARVWNVPRVVVIPNPIPRKISSTRQSRGEASDNRRIISLGRLTSQKRFDLLISAFALIAARHADWSLHIWGDGPLRHELSSQIERLGMKHCVFLCGKTERPWVTRAGGVLRAFVGFRGVPEFHARGNGSRKGLRRD